MSAEIIPNVRMVGFDVGPCVSGTGEALLGLAVRLLQEGNTEPVQFPTFVFDIVAAERLIAMLQYQVEEGRRMTTNARIQ